MKKLIGIILTTLSFSSFAQDPNFLTIEQVMSSKLTDFEKGIATMTLDTDAMIKCFSANESSNSHLTEQLQIYRLDMGLTVAIYKDYRRILKVAVNELAVIEMEAIYNSKNRTAVFNEAAPSTEESLSISFPRIIPFMGKLGQVSIKNPNLAVELVCKKQ